MQKYVIPCKFKSQSLDQFPLLLLAAKECSVLCTLFWLSVTFDKLTQTLVALTTNPVLLAQGPVGEESRQGSCG